ISVLGNEQIVGGNGVTTRSIEVNALDISFTGFPLDPLGALGTVSGDFIFSHSEAALVAVPPPVPEPAALVLVGTGCLTLLLSARCRRRKSNERSGPL